VDPKGLRYAEEGFRSFDHHLYNNIENHNVNR
jgi:hypothetical protein